MFFNSILTQLSDSGKTAWPIVIKAFVSYWLFLQRRRGGAICFKLFQRLYVKKLLRHHPIPTHVRAVIGIHLAEQ